VALSKWSRANNLGGSFPTTETVRNFTGVVHFYTHCHVA